MHHGWLQHTDRLVPPFPLVCVGIPPAGFPADFVGIDEDVVGQLAVEHLHALGYKRCGYVIALDSPKTRERLSAFRQRAQSVGMWDSSLLLDLRRWQGENPGFTVTTESLRAVEKFLGRVLGPLAMFTHNDYVAAALVECLVHHGCRVPGDVAVMGVDNDPLYALANVALTTVELPTREMGREAARLLCSRLGQHGLKGQRQELLPSTLIVRGSTVSPDQAAPWLHTVLTAVDEELHKPNLVKRLARQLGWREEELSRHFHRAMGCTFLQYRNRRRLQQAALMLREKPEAKISCAPLDTVRRIHQPQSLCGTVPPAFRRIPSCLP